MKRLLATVAIAGLLALPLAAHASWNGSAALGPTTDPDSYGSASISIDNSNFMTVVVEIFNLDPNTSHASHIHLGSCQQQGSVYVGLASIVCDGTGHGTATTNVQLTAAQVTTLTTSPVYVNVHHQTTFAGTTCGDITWGATPVSPGTWGTVKALYR